MITDIKLIQATWRKVFGDYPVLSELEDVYGLGPGLEVDGIHIYPHPSGFEVGEVETVVIDGVSDVFYYEKGTYPNFWQALVRAVNLNVESLLTEVITEQF